MSTWPCVHYELDFYPGVVNHTMGFFAKLLRVTENSPISLSCALYEYSRTTPLCEAILDGKEVCLTSLINPF